MRPSFSFYGGLGPRAFLSLDIDSHKEHSDSENMNSYEQDCFDGSKRLDEHAKEQGSWCYECNDRCSNISVLKRYMHNNYGMDIYPEIDMMLHGG